MEGKHLYVSSLLKFSAGSVEVISADQLNNKFIYQQEKKKIANKYFYL